MLTQPLVNISPTAHPPKSPNHHPILPVCLHDHAHPAPHALRLGPLPGLARIAAAVSRRTPSPVHPHTHSHTHTPPPQTLALSAAIDSALVFYSVLSVRRADAQHKPEPEPLGVLSCAGLSLPSSRRRGSAPPGQKTMETRCCGASCCACWCGAWLPVSAAQCQCRMS